MDLSELEALEGDEKPKKKPPLSTRVYHAIERQLGPAAPALPLTLFIVGWAYVNLLLASPSPEHGYGLAWLQPSAEMVGFLALTCGICALRPKAPKLLTLAFMLLLLPMWLNRFVDQLALETFARPFHLAHDYRDVWELLILLDDTVDRFSIVLSLMGSAVVLGVLFGLAHQAFTHAGRYFAESKWARTGFAVVAGLLVLSELATGSVFAPSLTVRAFEELGNISSLDARRAERQRSLDDALAQVGADHDLTWLQDADVHVFVVPRYAQMLRDDPRVSPQLRTRWGAFEAALRAARYEVRSALIRSGDALSFDTYEVTALETGVPVRDRLDQDLVVEHPVPSLGAIFHEAGYRSVSVLAGETRERPERELGGYDQRYHSWELGYLGLPFGRSPLPDQYVLSLIRDREYWEHEEPLFVFYALSSSVPPFSPLPRYLPDWSEVGRGDVYRNPPPGEPNHGYFELDQARDDYVAAMIYELDVLEGYLTGVVDAPAPEGRGRDSRRARRRRPPPLFLVVGDRPPLPSLAGPSTARAAIAHAISRRGSFLAPFAEAGWADGVIPQGNTAEMTHDALARWLVGSRPEAEP